MAGLEAVAEGQGRAEADQAQEEAEEDQAQEEAEEVPGMEIPPAMEPNLFPNSSPTALPTPPSWYSCISLIFLHSIFLHVISPCFDILAFACRI